MSPKSMKFYSVKMSYLNSYIEKAEWAKWCWSFSLFNYDT